MTFTFNGIAQIAVYFAILLLITKPVGLYLTAVFNNGRTWLDPVLRPVERVLYRISGVRDDQEQDWKIYTVAMLIFSLAGLLLTYIVERLQNHLPLNPTGQSAVNPLL